MTEPIQTKTLGGLTYNANQVKTARKNPDGKYELVFKNGEKLTYPEQNQKTITKNNGEERVANPTVKLKIRSGLIYDNTDFSIKNVMGATFTTSKESVSHVTLVNSENTTIDLSANNSKLYGDGARVIKGKNNTVKMDSQDHASFNIRGPIIHAEGVATQKDYDK